MKNRGNLNDENLNLNVKRKLSFELDDNTSNKSNSYKDLHEDIEDKDILGEFKSKQKIYISNKENINHLNEPLMKVHRISMQKKEFAQVRPNLKKNITDLLPRKLPRKFGPVSIDKSRAQRMAHNFFSKRLKSLTVSRMKSEDSIKTVSELSKLKPNKNLNNIKLEKKTDNFKEKEKIIINKIKNMKINTGDNDMNKYYIKNRRLTTDINQNIEELNLKQNPLGIREKKNNGTYRLNLDKISNNVNCFDNDNDNDDKNKNNNYYTIEINKNKNKSIMVDNKLRKDKEININKNNNLKDAKVNKKNSEDKTYYKKNTFNNKTINTPIYQGIKININNNYYTNKRSNHTIHSIKDTKNNTIKSNTRHNTLTIKTNLNNFNNTISYNFGDNKRTSSLTSLTQPNRSSKNSIGRRSNDSIPALHFDKLKIEKQKEKNDNLSSYRKQIQMLKGHTNSEVPKEAKNVMIKVNKRNINNDKNELKTKKVEKKEEKNKTEKDIKVRYGKSQMNDVEKQKNKKIERKENGYDKKIEIISNGNKDVNSVKCFYKRRVNKQS